MRNITRRAFDALGGLAFGLAFAGALSLAIAQGFILPAGTSVIGMLNGAGAVPTVANCTLTAGSTDSSGQCTATSGAPVVTFATVKNAAPSCVVQDASATPAVVYTVSTTAITITGTTAHVYYWVCFGKVGG